MKSNGKYVYILFFTILFLWTIFRYLFKFSEATDEFIAKPLLMLLPTLFIVKVIEKKKLSSVGLSNKNFLRNALIGLAAGVFISAEAVATHYFKNNGIVFNPENIQGFEFILLITIPFATGFVEEVVFRGYIFNRLWLYYRSEIIANAVSTALFVIIHLPLLIFVNYTSPFNLEISVFQLSMLGALDGFLFARTKTIAASTITHGIWNLSAVLFR